MLKKMICGAVAAIAMAGTISVPAKAGTEAYIGEVFLFGGNFCPRNTMEANGQTMQISTHSALFSLLGTMYGGDGRTTFKLPDLRRDAPKSRGGSKLKYCIVIQGVYPSRS